MAKYRSTHIRPPAPTPSNRAIGFMIAWALVVGIVLDVVIFKALGAW